jgi:2,3-bisphosphoglycerate-independent phosphoglycerate mutase
MPDFAVQHGPEDGFSPASAEAKTRLRLPAALVIMDGYGLAESGPGNAVTLADTPNLDRLFAECPWAPVACSGPAVGLPEGQMGNSEVGHLNIGAGRVVYQELTRINLAVRDGSLAANPVLREAIDGAVADGRAVHLMGLVSDGGVHSHITHLFGLLEMAKSAGAPRVFVHCFLDGRDVPPESGAGFVAQVEERLAALGVGSVATVQGRYWAMDRDNRWDRVERGWRAMVLGEGRAGDGAVAAIERSYRDGVTDEFVAPVVIEGVDGRMSEGDAVVFFNFRPDRAREITRALVDPAFDRFERSAFPALRFVCLTEYDPTIPAPVAFPKEFPSCTLADALAQAGLRQLHIAETEKYAHVTFFLNGGREPMRPGEERVLVPSPSVATYDVKPEMSEPGVTERLVEAVRADEADVYIVNYANCDMVGHTGVLPAAVAAVEAVDDGVGRVVEAVRARGGVVLVTADHGNVETMLDGHGGPFTAHTTDDVPLVCVAEGVTAVRSGGRLADIAPTLLDLVGLALPSEWSGESLLVR